MRELAGVQDLTPFDSPADSSCRESRCSLCGLPLGKSRLRKTIGGEVLRFCCPGCEQVFSLLSVSPWGIPRNFRDTELYQACVQSGIILSGAPFSLPHPPAAAGTAESDIPPLPLTLRVGGMWCPACSWLIEEVLRRTRGVLDPRVSFFSDRVELKYLPHLLSPAEVMERIAKLGYHPSLQLEGEDFSREKKDLLVRLGISAILAMNIMMISFALYFGFFRDLSPAVISYFSYPLWLMATPALFYGGLPILRMGFASLLYRRPTMETLIAVASLSAYAYSVYQMTQGSLHLYFDTASMLITLVLLGRYIEIHAREKVTGGISDLYQMSFQKVRLRDQYFDMSTPTLALPVGGKGLLQIPPYFSPVRREEANRPRSIGCHPMLSSPGILSLSWPGRGFLWMASSWRGRGTWTNPFSPASPARCAETSEMRSKPGPYSSAES